MTTQIPGTPDSGKPYGLHRLWITPYTDGDGTILSDTSYRMPIARKLAFTENADNDTLDGDDKAAVGEEEKGATVSGSIEVGGIDLMCWSIITGGQLIEEGVEPNVVRILRKKGSDTRPYFRVDGQSLAQKTSDVVQRIYRCKASGKIQNDSAYGTFQTPSVDFTGTPMPGDDDDYLWEWQYHQSKTTLGSTPDPNPLPIPSNLTVGTIAATTVALSWGDLPTADSYQVQQSSDGDTWTDVTSGDGGQPTDPDTTVTTLTTATLYYFRVAGVFAGVTGDYSSSVTATTS